MFRVIPSILANHRAQVKGEGFNNWRVVGTVMQAARVHSRRDVDELLVLDVFASKERRCIDVNLVESLTEFLRVPLTVGGGIQTCQEVEAILRAGADRICIGYSPATTPSLVKDLARNFGTQAIVCSLDVDLSHQRFFDHRLETWHPFEIDSHLEHLEDIGVGEVLLQRVDLDGTMEGLDINLIQNVAQLSRLPVIASSGLSSPANAAAAATAGASAVAGGAIFQFTEHTPLEIKLEIARLGHPIRR